MILKEQQADGSTQLVNLSPYGEWRASPMGLAGRDPIFFAQLQSETNNLPRADRPASRPPASTVTA